MDEVAEALKGSPLFAGFTDVGLKILGAVAQPRHVTDGQPVYLEGETGDALFVVRSGELSVCLRDGDAEVEIGRLDTGDTFGELALVTAGPRLTSVYAVGQVELLAIPRKDFGKLQRKKPQACLKLLLGVMSKVGRELGESRDAWRDVLLAAARGA